MSEAYPDDRRYVAAHTWARLDGDIATVGITDHAQDALGDIVYFAPPELEQQVMAGASFGELESVKAVSDLLAPLDGVVTEVNEAVVESPEQVNGAPNAAWLVRLRIADSAQYDQMLDAASYQALLG